MNIFKKFIKNISPDESNQDETNLNIVPMHKTFKNSHNFLSNNNDSYDLIFVDGGHGYQEVLVDLLYRYKFLNLDGILLIDDYDWDSTDKTKSVRLATNHFLDIIENTFVPIYNGQFAAIIKKKILILIN